MSGPAPGETIASRLRYARELADELSARELDRLAGKAQGHASLIEARPDADARAGTLRVFAEILGLSLDWLIVGKGKAPTRETVCAAVKKAREGRRAA
jgi:hypothetical protein